MLLASKIAEVVWMCKLLKDLHICLPKKPILYCDNISALTLASNLIYHAHTKHLLVKSQRIIEKPQWLRTEGGRECRDETRTQEPILHNLSEARKENTRVSMEGN